jgi:Holliday junction DNA helicase RuvB
MSKNNFRPKTFQEVVGQDNIKQYLKIKVDAFHKTGTCPSHMLFLGFSGAGKTTLANVMANELGTKFHSVMATNIRTFDDLYNIFKDVEKNDIVFFDEIHAIAPKIQEHLYSVLEDFKLSTYNKSLQKQQTFDLPRFTCIGATTHSGDLNAPLLSRFQTKSILQPYTKPELTKMIQTAGKRIYGIDLDMNICEEMAQLSKNTARNAYNLLDSLMVVAEASCTSKVQSHMINKQLLHKTLRHENIDPCVGLEYSSRNYLVNLVQEGQSEAVGVKTLSSLCREQESNIINLIEPPLVAGLSFTLDVGPQKVSFNGPFVKITKNGRRPTQIAIDYIKTCQYLQQKDNWFPQENLTIKEKTFNA